MFWKIKGQQDQKGDSGEKHFPGFFPIKERGL